MEMLKMIFPVAIGAFIGYGTNLIAIKMLFHPSKEMRLLGRRVPFTPGVIPKNQGRLARAVGEAIAGTLLTARDFEDALKDGNLKRQVAISLADRVMTSEHSLGDFAQQFDLEDPDALPLTEKIQDAVTQRLLTGIQQIDFSALVMETAGKAFMEKIQGSMLGMFVNEGMIASLAEPIGEALKVYLEEHGYEILSPMVHDEMEELLTLTNAELLMKLGIDASKLETLFGHFYEKLVDEGLDGFLQNIDISGLVENKIRAMDVQELEELVMSVMKHELQTVVNLGALIGALIGAANLLIP